MMKQRSQRREAFTLVELLVVVAIIAMLAGLLLAAVQKARVVAETLECRKDITELHKAITAFCTDPRLGMPGYLPSKFGSDPASKAYFLRLFPRADAQLGQLPPGLTGDQCLVYFLRGPKGQGWSSNQRDPFEPPRQGVDRIGPFYEFKSERFDPQGSPYPAYLDRWRKRRIAYFCAMRNVGNDWMPNQYDDTDCLVLNVLPYTGSNPPETTMNPTSFQLISAGPDGKFGNGGNMWSPLNPANTPGYRRGEGGADDVTNFWNGPLGGRK